jgi:hypothetical protein
MAVVLFFFHLAPVLVSDVGAQVLCIKGNNILIRQAKCKGNETKATITNLAPLLSAVGPTGPQGATGPTGPQGATGLPGADGANGISGRSLQESSNSVTNIAAVGSAFVNVTCSSILKPVGGGCQSSNSGLVPYYSYADETASFFSWFCGFRNVSGATISSATITAHAVCALAQ